MDNNNIPNDGRVHQQPQYAYPPPPPAAPPAGYTVTPAQTVTISFSALKWVIGAIIVICVQGFTFWNLIDNKFISLQSLVERVDVIEVVSKDNERLLSDKDIYIEKGKNLTNKVNDLVNRVDDQSNYQEKNYDQISTIKRENKALKLRIEKLEDTITENN